jgi:hypothetical protein
MRFIGRSAAATGSAPAGPLRSLKMEFDFHSIEREDDPTIFYAVEHSSVQ